MFSWDFMNSIVFYKYKVCDEKFDKFDMLVCNLSAILIWVGGHHSTLKGFFHVKLTIEIL